MPHTPANASPDHPPPAPSAEPDETVPRATSQGRPGPASCTRTGGTVSLRGPDEDLWHLEDGPARHVHTVIAARRHPHLQPNRTRPSREPRPRADLDHRGGRDDGGTVSLCGPDEDPRHLEDGPARHVHTVPSPAVTPVAASAASSSAGPPTRPPGTAIPGSACPADPGRPRPHGLLPLPGIIHVRAERVSGRDTGASSNARPAARPGLTPG